MKRNDCGRENYVTDQVKGKALFESEKKYRTLFENMNEGVSLSEVIYDKAGRPVDFRYVEVNQAYEKTTGLKASDIIGKTLLEIAPDIEPHWMEMFATVSVTGEPAQLEGYNRSTKRYYENYAFSPSKGYLSVLLRDITQRVKTEQELKKQKEALAGAIRMKDEFLATITHEFKTPLNVINAALQTIEKIYGDETPTKVKKHLHRIKINSLRQLRLVNNLLDITKYKAGHLKINKRNLDIVFLSKVIIESVTPYAKQKGLSVVFSSDIVSKEIAIDEEKYERILLNLLSNAIKFTPRGRSIYINILIKNRTATILVKDEGIGIPKNKQKLIFERFGQVDSSLSRQAEGTGIGLSLVKSLVEGMGGTVSVESDVNCGSTFTVCLPITKTRRKEPQINILNSVDNKILATAIEFSDIYIE